MDFFLSLLSQSRLRDCGSLFKLLIYTLAVSALLLDSSKLGPNWDANVSPGSQALLLSPGEGVLAIQGKMFGKITSLGLPTLWGEKRMMMYETATLEPRRKT